MSSTIYHKILRINTLGIKYLTNQNMLVFNGGPGVHHNLNRTSSRCVCATVARHGHEFDARIGLKAFRQVGHEENCWRVSEMDDDCKESGYRSLSEYQAI